ncbi:MAG TPA: GNAT family N-acetyltransferase [Bacteroidales bacterium]|nr:GNAT family N-acetyltransferase [Bacteroidales bacterium]
MIQFIKNESISRDLWDKAIMQSPQPMMYAMSWYLDLVTPGWDGLIEDNYQAVMPLIGAKKFGIHYLYQPPFCQQLGVFGKNVSTDVVKSFLLAIPRKYRFAEIMLNESNKIDLPNAEMLTNITLQLGCAIENIRTGYNENTRRNIRKAEQNKLSVYKGFDIENIISLFKTNKGEALGKNESWYSTLKTLSYQLRHLGLANTFCALNQHNEIIAGILLVEFNGRAVLLFSGSDSEARETGAMHFLIDSILKDICTSHQIFDFEGSNNENLAKFYLGFGGEKSSYPFVRINRLPFPVRWMKGKGLDHSQISAK